MRLQRKIAAKTESTWSLHHHQQQQQRHSSSNSNNRARSSHHSFKLSSLIYPHSAIRLLVTSTLIQMILITNSSPILCGEQWPPIIQFQSLKWEEDINGSWRLRQLHIVANTVGHAIPCLHRRGVTAVVVACSWRWSHGIGSSSFLHCHDNPPAGKAVDANPCRSNCCDINPQKL